MVIATYGVAIYIYIIGWVEMGSAGWAMVSGWFTEKTWEGWANIMIRCLWQNHFTYWGRHTWNAQENVSCQGCVWSKLIRPLSDHSQTTLRAWFGSCFPTSTVFSEWRWYWTQRSCVSLGCALVKFVNFMNPIRFTWTPKSLQRNHGKPIEFVLTMLHCNHWRYCISHVLCIPGMFGYHLWLLHALHMLHGKLRMTLADIGDGATIYVSGAMLSFWWSKPTMIRDAASFRHVLRSCCGWETTWPYPRRRRPEDMEDM